MRNEQWHITLSRGHISPLKDIIWIIMTASASRIKFCGIKIDIIFRLQRDYCIDVCIQRSQLKHIKTSLVFSTKVLTISQMIQLTSKSFVRWGMMMYISHSTVTCAGTTTAVVFSCHFAAFGYSARMTVNKYMLLGQSRW